MTEQLGVKKYNVSPKVDINLKLSVDFKAKHYIDILRVQNTCKNNSYNYYNWSLSLDHNDWTTPFDTTISRMVIGHFVQRVGIDDSILFKVVKHVWSPVPDYKFPSHSGRPFQFKWLKRVPWLCYSAKNDGTFCRYFCLPDLPVQLQQT